MIVKATVSDAKRLTEIALKSKAFWGYSDELIESWREELTVSEQMISEMFVFTFLQEGRIVGFYFLNPPKQKSIELEMLFVLPGYIGKGIGKQLLQHSFKEAINLNAKTMTLLADPNAVRFYESKGFYKISQKQSSIAGRFLLVMQKEL